MKNFTEIGTICGRPLILTTATEYNKLPKSKTRLNIAYTFTFHGNQIVVYHDKVRGFIKGDELHFFTNDYNPYWFDYCAVKDYVPIAFDRVVAIDGGNSSPNTQPTPHSGATKEETSIAPTVWSLDQRNTPHENRNPVPASLYSSWIHPEVENSLCGDYWLSNIDRLICETLADGATIVDKYLTATKKK